MQALRDKARELVGLAEGAILKREAAIASLRRELEKARVELAATRDQLRAFRSPKCQGCVYKVIALEALEKDEKVQEKWSITK